MAQLIDNIDLFPALVQTPRGRLQRTRLVIRDGRAYVWAERHRDGRTRVDLVEQASVESFGREREARSPYLLVTTDGEQWECRRDGGCGCGSKLRTLNVQSEIAALAEASA